MGKWLPVAEFTNGTDGISHAGTGCVWTMPNPCGLMIPRSFADTLPVLVILGLVFGVSFFAFWRIKKGVLK